MSERPLLVLALDGADGDVIQSMLDEGRLPHLLALIERGTMAETAWTPPGPGIGQWLTVATGLPPYRHGAILPTVPRPDGYGATRAERRNLKAPPLWERVAATGRETSVVNWPATQGTDVLPDMPLTAAADTFFYMEGQSFENWPAFPESVSPRAATRGLLDSRVHAAALRDEKRPSRLGDIDGMILRTLRERGWLAVSGLESMVGVARRLMAPGSASFVFLDFLEEIGLPGGRSHVEAVLGGYRLLDEAVARLVTAAGERADIAIVTRPPSTALDGLSPAEAPRGIAVFVSPAHEADALAPVMTPLALAEELARMAAVSSIPPAETAAPAEAADWLAPLLAERYPAQTPAMNRDRIALQAAQFQQSVEMLRSMLHAGGSADGALPEVRLAVAEKLWRDGAPDLAKAALAGEEWPQELLPWRDRLKTFLTSGGTA
jgi:hypothetical protein